MVSLTFLFWMYVVLFAVIGAMRGWAKELLVAFSVILSLAINHVLVKYVPVVKELPPESSSLFWVRAFVVIAVIYFGYQTVISIQRLAARATRERLQDTLFGAVLGAVNGYLIAGTIWFYLDATKYEVIATSMIFPPDGPLARTIKTMMVYMPPNLLGEPGIYIAVILAFVFVLVVYI